MSEVKKDQLYVYGLDQLVLADLEVMYFSLSTLTQVSQSPSNSGIASPKVIETDEHNTLECAACSITFSDAEERRIHYKLDFHRYNLKRSLSGLAPVTEDKFEELVENASIESLSGSDSDSDEAEDEVDHLEALLQRQKLDMVANEEESVSFLNTRSPFILFKSSTLSTDKALGVYKALFGEKVLEDGSLLDTLRKWSLPPVKEGKSALFMIGGGHFAGAIISHVPKNIKGNAKSKTESIQEQKVDIIVSKTFHRYTTRRKQGGSQSASDNARGKANSAGSSIRRYNEQALVKEVRDLLTEWKDQLDGCHLIFIRANGASNRKILVGYEGSVLKADDPRIKSFPFTTKRAVTSSLKKAWVELSYMSVVDVPREDEKAKKARERNIRELQSKQKIRESSVEPTATAFDPNEEHTKKLIALLNKQSAPLFISYLRKNNLDINSFRLAPRKKYGSTSTLLHYAAANKLTHMIKVLIVNLKADPTLLNEGDRTAWQVTSDPNTKRQFQIIRSQVGENGDIDWEKAKVGPPKSKEDFEKEDKTKEEEAISEKKKLHAEAINKKTEMEMKKPTYSSVNLMSPAGSLNQLTGLTEQQKMRLMREQRARAAEERMKRLQQNK